MWCCFVLWIVSTSRFSWKYKDVFKNTFYLAVTYTSSIGGRLYMHNDFINTDRSSLGHIVAATLRPTRRLLELCGQPPINCPSTVSGLLQATRPPKCGCLDPSHTPWYMDNKVHASMQWPNPYAPKMVSNILNNHFKAPCWS